jgi:glutamate-1-semialdehyde 2,1-aminomutase
MILGHAHPAVVEAVTAAARRGHCPSAPRPRARSSWPRRSSPDAPVEQVRLVNSGTEATMSRDPAGPRFTGRRWSSSSPAATTATSTRCWPRPAPASPPSACPTPPASPPARPPTPIVLPYNDVAAVEAVFAEHGDQIACVITEAAAGNMGVVPPLDGLQRRAAPDHRRARRAADPRRGDDRLPGVRSGWYGLDPVDADLFTFGKVMGGGLPAAAFGGRADVMDQLAPAGPVYQAGTLSGNPVAVAAGLATLRHSPTRSTPAATRSPATLRGAASAALFAAGRAAPRAAGRQHVLVFFVPDERQVRDYDDARTQDVARYTAFFHAMLARGVYLPPSAFEAWFVNAALRRRGARPGARGAARRARAPPRRRRRGRRRGDP